MDANDLIRGKKVRSISGGSSCDPFDEKRNAHTAAEQKRRNAIKHGIKQLKELIPGCNPEDDEKLIVSKQSKAQILQKGIDYLSDLKSDIESVHQENGELEKKLLTLQIAKRSYEKMVNERDTPEQQEIPHELKYQLFQKIMEALWEPFNVNVSSSDFVTTIIPWLEQYCKPDIIKNCVNKAWRTLFG